MKTSLLFAVALLLGVGATGCRCWEKPAAPPRITAVRTTEKITVDGVPDEKAWAAAPAVALEWMDSNLGRPPETLARIAQDPFESARVKVLYDDRYLYIGVELDDNDVMNYNFKDQQMHFKDGDTMEVFLKPVAANHYWEFYVTPGGHKTSYFYRSGGAIIEESWRHLMPGMIAAAKVRGTLNRHGDTDQGWTAEIAVPLVEIAKAGVKFGPAEAWTIFPARYNYSSKFRSFQNSGYPALPQPNNHLTEFYPAVDFK